MSRNTLILLQALGRRDYNRHVYRRHLMKQLIALGMAATGLALAGTHLVSAKTGAQTPKAPKTSMTFFITSVGSGKGGDLGGLKGADQHCQQLATAVGAGDRTWHAYLSTSAGGGQPAVN